MHRLALLCLAYGGLYTVYGVVIKYYLKRMSGMEFLFHSTLWSMSLALLIIAVLGWPSRLKSNNPKGLWGIFPIEYAWIIPSGICTGFVVPTTSLMYTFGFNVMVAMMIMRNALIIISPGIDAILIAQGHSTKKVLWQEYIAVLMSIGAMFITIFAGGNRENFEFFKSPAVMITMAAYIFPYGLRLYIMSRFKTKIDQRAFLATEQIWATASAFGVGAIVIAAYKFGLWQPGQVKDFVKGFDNPSLPAMLWSTPYSLLAFASVFLYLYKYGSTTFNTTINRLTSLIAGTAASLVAYYKLGGKPIKNDEWIALVVTFVALGFLYWADKRREKEDNRLQLA